MPRLRPALVLLLLCGPAAAQEFAPSDLGEMQRPLGYAAQADLWRPIAGQRDRNGNRTSVRRGQASDVLLLALSAAAGAGVGMVVQRSLDVRIGPVPPLAAAGALTVAGAAAMDVSLLARAFFAVGGAAYAAGSLAYTRLVPRPEGT
mgnify:CR=1 FL=1